MSELSLLTTIHNLEASLALEARARVQAAEGLADALQREETLRSEVASLKSRLASAILKEQSHEN